MMTAHPGSTSPDPAAVISCNLEADKENPPEPEGRTVKGLPRFATAMSWICIDTETTGLNFWKGARPFMVQTYSSDDQLRVWEWPVDPQTRQPIIPAGDRAEIGSCMCDYHFWVFHNAKFDIRALWMSGIPAVFCWDERIHDTLLASHVMDSLESHRLNDLALKYFRVDDSDARNLRKIVISARRIAKKLDWDIASAVGADYWLPKAVADAGHAPPGQENIWKTVCRVYGVRDVRDRTAPLWQMYWHELNKPENADRMRCYQRERKLQPIVYEMERTGFPVRKTALARKLRELKTEISSLEGLIRRATGEKDFNPNSNQQVGKFLSSQIPAYCLLRTAPSDNYPEGQIKTDADSLGVYLANAKSLQKTKAARFLTLLADHAKRTTRRGYLQSYQDHALPEGLDGISRIDRIGGNDRCRTLRIHCNMNQTGTDERNVRTTRFSSTDPNLMNVGKEDRSGQNLRGVFGPDREHVWYCLDYSQLELRILAVVSGEQRMLDAFAAGEDIHQVTSDACDIPRPQAKNVNFAVVYGASNSKLREMSGREDIGDVFKRAYPDAYQWTRKTTRQAERDGYVTTLGGYRLYVPPDRPYAGVDYIIQGSAGIIVKDAMIACASLLSQRRKAGGRMLLQIHDELVFEFKKPRSDREQYSLNRTVMLIRRAMEQAGDDLGVTTPVDVSIVRSGWDKPKGVRL